MIRTPLTEQYFADEGFEQELAVSVPLRRYGTAGDVAQAALYLASDMASYVTGVALPVDGGWLAEKSFVSGTGPSSFLAGNETATAPSRGRPDTRGRTRRRTMGQAIGGMLAMAVAVAVSPIPIIAVVLLLTGPGGKTKGVAYVVGSVTSTAILGGVLVWRRASARARAATAGRPPARRCSSSRSACCCSASPHSSGGGRPLEGEEAVMPKWMGALDAFGPAKALAAGVVLNVLQPEEPAAHRRRRHGRRERGRDGSAGGGRVGGLHRDRRDRRHHPGRDRVRHGRPLGRAARPAQGWMAHNSGVIMAVILLLIGVKLLGDGIAGL